MEAADFQLIQSAGPDPQLWLDYSQGPPLQSPCKVITAVDLLTLTTGHRTANEAPPEFRR
jgi:hypothetical protein